MPLGNVGFVWGAPAALIAAGLLSLAQPGMRPRTVLAAARYATVVTFLIAVLAAVAVARHGAVTSVIGSGGAVGLSIRLDAFSAVMFLLVSFIGVIVNQFSRQYLDGDARQGAFVGGLCLTLAAVCLLVLSGGLFQLVAAWVATSLALHRLLKFYAERPAAQIAAVKKFITARIGDACLIAAALLLTSAFGSGDIGTILERARAIGAGAAPPGVTTAGLLIAFAALLKSAQFPAHGWLPEVMETPTPVSALLHAGIINAGGFLVIRFADVMLLAPSAMHLLALVGGFTALFGAVVMLTQSSVKVSLGWSTVGQMGFMLLECGLGAFPIAVLHIVAHSFYKAHAFLSSGSVIDIARAAWTPDLKARPRLWYALASLALSFGLYAAISFGFTRFAHESATALALGSILILGLTLMITESMEGGTDARVVGRAAIAAAGVTVAYFLLQGGAVALLSPTLPPIPAPTQVDIAIMGLVVASFGVVTLLQIDAAIWIGTPAWRAARVHVANGLYANALFNRLVGALRSSAAELS